MYCCSFHHNKKEETEKQVTEMGLLPKSIAQNLTILSSILLLLCLCHVARCKPNTTVKIVQCNIGTYTKGDPFTISLAYVLAELEDVTPARQGYDFRNISPYPNAFAYGHAACNQTLTSSDCAACLSAARAAVLSSCDERIGGRSVLYDCTIRYEQYPFDD